MWPGSTPSSVVNAAASLTIMAIIIAALYLGAHILIPLALAGVLSFLLQPLVRWVRARLLPRTLAVLSVVMVTTFFIGLAGSFLAREVSYLVGDLPKYESNLRDKAKAASNALQSVGIWSNAFQMFERMETDFKTAKDAPPLKVEIKQEDLRSLTTLLAYAKLTLAPLATLGLTFLFTIFILLQYNDLRDRVVFLFGPSEIGRTTQAFNEAAHDLSKFFRLQAGLNLSFGIVVGLALWLIGLPNPVLWGALAAVSRFVPYVGGIVAAVGPILIAASVDPGWGMVITTAVVIILAEVLVGYAVEPLLFGTHTPMSPLAVLAAASFWTTVWGPVGLILAVPITLAIVVFGEHVPRLAFLRVLFGNTPTLSEAQRLYHQLLAGNASVAIEDAGEATKDRQSVIAYAENVFLPAMAIASRDLRHGVFRDEQLAELKRTTKEFVEQFKEIAEDHFLHEVQGVDAAAEDCRVVVVGGRGPFDQAAAELSAFVISDPKSNLVSCTALGGLTGIASAAAPDEGAVRYLVIVTAGGVTDAQLDLLSRRALRDLRPERIGILIADHVSPKEARAEIKKPKFHSLKALRADVLGKAGEKKKQPAATPDHKTAAE